MEANGKRLVLTYDEKGLTIAGEGVPAQLAVWMLETAKASIISNAGKRPAWIKGLDLGPLGRDLLKERR